MNTLHSINPGISEKIVLAAAALIFAAIADPWNPKFKVEPDGQLSYNNYNGYRRVLSIKGQEDYVRIYQPQDHHIEKARVHFR